MSNQAAADAALLIDEIRALVSCGLGLVAIVAALDDNGDEEVEALAGWARSNLSACTATAATLGVMFEHEDHATAVECATLIAAVENLRAAGLVLATVVESQRTIRSAVAVASWSCEAMAAHHLVHSLAHQEAV